jgi:hypothetical protein
MKTPSRKRSQRKKVTITPGTGRRMTVGDLPTSADIVRGTTDHSIGVTYEAGAPEPMAAAFQGVGALEANATIVEGVGVARGSALSERPAEIRDAARALSQEFMAQVEELKRSRPNDDRLAKHDDLVAFFEKMAAGLSNLADALDRAVNEATEGKLEPAFLGTAAEVVRQLQLGAMEWLEKNRMTVFEVPFRIGLFGLGLAFVHALGVDNHFVEGLIAYLVRKSAQLGSDAPKKKR